MSDSDSRTCPSCGARLEADDDVCDLCGTAVEPQETAAQEEVTKPQQSSSQKTGAYCNQCGWKNPAGANFCSKCGSRLQDLSGGQQAAAGEQTEATNAPATKARDATPPPASSREPAKSQAAPDGDDGRRTRMVGILVGASVLVVVALFLMLVYTGGGQDGGGPTQPQAGASPNQAPPARSAMPAASADTQSVLSAEKKEPLADQFAGRADSLKQAIAQASDKTAPRRELMNLYVGAGRTDLAALQQRKIAQRAGTPEAWTKAGDRFYEWMMNASGPEKRNVAQVASNAYERVVRKQPDNLDVRTRLGWTYLQSQQNPMRGIQEIKSVIEEDPDHVAARMNYGIALAQIGRFEKAIKQFEHVQGISDESSPRYQQATQIIQNLRRQVGNGGSQRAPAPRG